MENGKLHLHLPPPRLASPLHPPFPFLIYGSCVADYPQVQVWTQSFHLFHSYGSKQLSASLEIPQPPPTLQHPAPMCAHTGSRSRLRFVPHERKTNTNCHTVHLGAVCVQKSTHTQTRLHNNGSSCPLSPGVLVIDSAQLLQGIMVENGG